MITPTKIDVNLPESHAKVLRVGDLPVGTCFLKEHRLWVKQTDGYCLSLDNTWRYQVRPQEQVEKVISLKVCVEQKYSRDQTVVGYEYRCVRTVDMIPNFSDVPSGSTPKTSLQIDLDVLSNSGWEVVSCVQVAAEGMHPGQICWHTTARRKLV